jgi:hypothetical protein
MPSASPASRPFGPARRGRRPDSYRVPGRPRAVPAWPRSATWCDRPHPRRGHRSRCRARRQCQPFAKRAATAAACPGALTEMARISEDGRVGTGHDEGGGPRKALDRSSAPVPPSLRPGLASSMHAPASCSRCSAVLAPLARRQVVGITGDGNAWRRSAYLRCGRCARRRQRLGDESGGGSAQRERARAGALHDSGSSAPAPSTGTSCTSPASSRFPSTPHYS